MKNFLIALLLSFAALESNQWFPSIPVALPSNASPVIQIDGTGHSVALWTSSDQTTLFSGTLPPNGQTWSVLTVATVGVGNLIIKPLLSLDSNGDAVAVWLESGLGGEFLEYSTLSSGSSSWTPSLQLSPSIAFPNESPNRGFSLGVDMNGNAVVIWSAFDNNDSLSHIRAATVPFASITAPTPTTLSTVGSPQGFNASIAVNANGDALAVWAGSDITASQSNIVGASFISGVWTTTDLTVLSSANLPFPLPVVAFNDSANGVAVWSASSGTGFPQPFFSSSFISGWNSVLNIAQVKNIDPTIPAYVVKIDENGDSLVVWIHPFSLVKSLTLTFGSGSWGNLLNIDEFGNVIAFDLAMIPSGIATVVFVDASTNGTEAAMLSNPSASSWTTPTFLSITAETGMPNYPPKVSGNALDEFIAIWLEQDLSVRSAFFGPSLAPPFPLNAKGARLSNQFLLQKEFLDQLSWSPLPASSLVVAYEIFRDIGLQELVGVVAATPSPQVFVVHNVKNTPQTYYLVSANALGQRSAPIPITIQ